MTTDAELPTRSFATTPPDDDGAAPPLPSRIGRYEVIRALGKCGFGVVYLARNAQLLRQVAVKVPYGDADESCEAWLSEAQMVAQRDHPNIVPVYDVGSTKANPAFIVSKLIDGTSLSAALRFRRFSIRETVQIIISIADALHYVHQQGLVHHDVKPGNIMLDTAGQVYLNDFGLVNGYQ